MIGFGSAVWTAIGVRNIGKAGPPSDICNSSMSGTSFTERVTELRLQRAYTLLTEASESKSRISDIALQAGFSDISHFNRLFRSRFGDTPKGVRTQGLRMRGRSKALITRPERSCFRPRGLPY